MILIYLRVLETSCFSKVPCQMSRPLSWVNINVAGIEMRFFFRILSNPKFFSIPDLVKQSKDSSLGIRSIDLFVGSKRISNFFFN